MPGVYGGDDISAIVLDAGSSSTRAGWAGEDTPRAVIPSSYGWIADESVAKEAELAASKTGQEDAMEGVETENGAETANGTGKKSISDWELAKVKAESRQRFVGDAGVNVWRKDMQVGNPFDDGILTSPASLLALARYSIHNVMRADPTEHPLLLTEPSWNTREAREELTQLAFEGLDVPAFYLANSTVLSSFSSGKPTSLMVDVGATQMSAIPVVDGFILRKGIQRSAGFGGDCISRALLYDLSTAPPSHTQRQGGPVTIVPRYLVKTKAPSVAGAHPPAKLREERILDTTESYKAFQTQRILHEAKETLAQILDEPWNEGQAAARPLRNFEFPDGYNDNFGIERFRAPETLFSPELFAEAPGVLPAVASSGSSHRSLVDLILSAVEATDVDSRATLLQNVVCVGGSSSIHGFNDRLSYELGLKLPGQKIKIHSSGNMTERKYSSWLGGSILASLGTFHQLWISKQEYQEHGPNIVHARCR